MKKQIKNLPILLRHNWIAEPSGDYQIACRDCGTEPEDLLGMLQQYTGFLKARGEGVQCDGRQDGCATCIQIQALGWPHGRRPVCPVHGEVLPPLYKPSKNIRK